MINPTQPPVQRVNENMMNFNDRNTTVINPLRTNNNLVERNYIEKD